LFNKNNNQFNVVSETEVSKLGIINPMGKLFLLDFLFYRQRRYMAKRLEKCFIISCTMQNPMNENCFFFYCIKNEIVLNN